MPEIKNKGRVTIFQIFLQVCQTLIIKRFIIPMPKPRRAIDIKARQRLIGKDGKFAKSSIISTP